jgi:hypothetical protein
MKSTIFNVYKSNTKLLYQPKEKTMNWFINLKKFYTIPSGFKPEFEQKPQLFLSNNEQQEIGIIEQIVCNWEQTKHNSEEDTTQ